MARRGLYANIHAKRKRIKRGSNEKMRKPGDKGAPTAANFRQAKKTAKKTKRKLGALNGKTYSKTKNFTKTSSS